MTRVVLITTCHDFSCKYSSSIETIDMYFFKIIAILFFTIKAMVIYVIDMFFFPLLCVVGAVVCCYGLWFVVCGLWCCLVVLGVIGCLYRYRRNMETLPILRSPTGLYTRLYKIWLLSHYLCFTTEVVFPRRVPTGLNGQILIPYFISNSILTCFA